LLRSHVVTTVGSVVVQADNASTLEATNKSLTETGADGAGVSLAFNTVGWKPQNIFFQTVDALVGAGIGEVDEGSTNRARCSTP
jgi:hypothetical protein